MPSVSAFRSSLNRVLVASFALALFCGLSTFAAAQDAASLTGVVTDSTGAVVPDVNVKLVDTRTNTAYEAKTSSVGTYTFHDLLPGPGYRITFAKSGFDAVTVPSLYLA